MSLLCASVFPICVMRVIYWPHLQITPRALVEGLQSEEGGGRRDASGGTLCSGLCGQGGSQVDVKA